MPPPPNPAPAERFAQLIDALCRAVAAHGARHRLAGPILLLLWSRLRRMAARVARLAARLRLGTLPPARRPASPRPGGPPPRRLPQGFAWVVRLVPEAASSASQLRHLLADPQMAALVEAAPSMGRLLRPLCRMLGVRPPPGLKPPPRPAASSRAARPPDRPPSAPRPKPHVPWPGRRPQIAA